MPLGHPSLEWSHCISACEPNHYQKGPFLHLTRGSRSRGTSANKIKPLFVKSEYTYVTCSTELVLRPTPGPNPGVLKLHNFPATLLLAESSAITEKGYGLGEASERPGVELDVWPLLVVVAVVFIVCEGFIIVFNYLDTQPNPHRYLQDCC